MSKIKENYREKFKEEPISCAIIIKKDEGKKGGCISEKSYLLGYFHRNSKRTEQLDMLTRYK